MIESKKITKSSVAAFVFMPQFALCLRGFSHIVPIFMRTIGLVFEQAGLISENHPATNYGSENVEKCGFGRMMQDAWRTLRTTRTTPRQWCVFGSVIFMITLTLYTLTTSIMTVGLGLNNGAQAQLFSIGTGATDDSTVPNITFGGMSASDPYDYVVPCATVPPLKNVGCTGNGHDDWAIMLLDKVLRQGMNGVGGFLQNGMQKMMETFNSGVLVIAGIMLAWAVLSVVVDTAKTGVVGGGRHNMVWAPIRIVFALGLLIPLGDVGFSSGQFMTTKLAEWGSNLGTNVWQGYLGGAFASAFLADQSVENPTSLIRAYTDMWLCRVAFNSYTYQATGKIDSGQLVKRVRTEGIPGVTRTWEYTFTNAAAANLCGTVTLPFLNGDPVWMMAQAESPPGLQKAISDYQMGVALAYGRLFDDNPGFVSAGKSLDGLARAWACDFAQRHIVSGQKPGSPTANPLVESKQCAVLTNALSFDGTQTDLSPIPGVPLGSCTIAGQPVDDLDGKLPNGDPSIDPNCIRALVKTYADEITTAAKVGRMGLATAFQADISKNDRGWASMGQWFMKLAQINEAVHKVAAPMVSVTPGELVHTGVIRQKVTSWFGSDIDAKVMEVEDKSTEWWKEEATLAQRPATGGTRTMQMLSDGSGTVSTGIFNQLSNSEIDGGSGVLGFAKKIASFINAATSPTGLLDMLMDNVMGNKATFLLALLAPSTTKLYPYVQVSEIGGAIFAGGWAFAVGATTIELLISIVPDGAGAAAVLVGGAIGSILTALSGVMILSGAILKWWLPIMPFIRVAFAVMSWIITVFEAVMLVPIAALAHITTEGDGIAGHAKQAWAMWTGLLLRPSMIVLGYVGAIMVFNGFVVYFNEGFKATVLANYSRSGGIQSIFEMAITGVIYVSAVYAVANSSFKLMEHIPDAMMMMLGGRGAHSFDDHAMMAGMMQQAGNMMSNFSRENKERASSVGKAMKQRSEAQTKDGAGASQVGGGGDGGGGGGGG
jgi:hypothetical protein